MTRNVFRPLFVLLVGCILCRTLSAQMNGNAMMPQVTQFSSAGPGPGGAGASDTGVSVTSASSEDDNVDPGEVEEGMSYLRKFGYFDDDDDGNPNHRSSPLNVEKAISHMQYKAHLPVTGKLNRETIAMMRRPRCGNKDINGPAERLRRRRRRYSTSGRKWRRTSLTYSLENLTEDLPTRITRAELQRAFKTWSDVTPLTFHEVPSGNNADIMLRFAHGQHGDGYEFDGRGGVLAHAFFPGSRHIDGDAHFDEGEMFTAHRSHGTNLFMVAAHELGHSLGLGHSDVESSLMAPFYQGYRHGFKLAPDDVRGIQSLYGRNTRPPKQPPNKPPTSPGNPGKPSNPLPPNTPTTCDIHIGSAMTTSATDMMVIRGNQYWDLRSNEHQRSYSVAGKGYPKPLASRFRARLATVDASYQRHDGSYRLFSGQNYHDFSQSGELVHKGPILELFRRRQRRGAPNTIQAAVIVPPNNNHVFLFNGRQYWRLNDEDNRIDQGYPQPLTRWSQSLTPGFTAAFYSRGSVYFVTGNTYQQYLWENSKIAIPPNGQLPRFDRQFFGCGNIVAGISGENSGNGQTSTVNGRNWALVPTMLMMSTAVCHQLIK